MVLKSSFLLHVNTKFDKLRKNEKITICPVKNVRELSPVDDKLG